MYPFTKVRGRMLAAAVAVIAVAVVAGITTTAADAEESATVADGDRGHCAPDPQPGALPATFEGKRLLVVSDADMAASAFQDGNLKPGNREPIGAQDALTVLGLPLQVGVPRAPAPDANGVVFGQAVVENSAIGPPHGIDVSPDGSRAYVLRTRGSAPPGTTQVNNVFADLPAEAVVSTVDISDPRAPKVVQTVVVGRLSHTLSLSPDGRYLAINTDQPGRNVVIREVTPNGNIGGEILAVHGSEEGQAVRRVGRVEWHPSGEFLAHGIPFEDELRFYRFTTSGGAARLLPWGAPVKVGKFPDEGVFSADGRHYFTTDLHWGDDVPGLFYDPPPGSVTAIRFDAEGGRHRITGQARTDVSPEGIAVSPDGRFVVTENLVRSWKPWNDPLLSPGGSINLLEFDKRTGRLTTRQHLPLNGILPEGITFDASGNHVAATIFDHYDPRYRRGSVQFFTLVRDDCPNLVRTNVDIQTPAGPHTVHLIR
jgi:DNA-binding beta-propeller fold protein YncE